MIDPAITVALVVFLVIAGLSITLGPRSKRLPDWANYTMGVVVIIAGFTVLQYYRGASWQAVQDLLIIAVAAGVPVVAYRIWLYVSDLRDKAHLADVENKS